MNDIQLWDGRYHRPKQTLYRRYILRNIRDSFPAVMLDWKMRKPELKMMVRVHQYFGQVYDDH